MACACLSGKIFHFPEYGVKTDAELLLAIVKCLKRKHSIQKMNLVENS
jgi:hypothetical protein